MPTPPVPLILLVEDEPHIADIQLAYLKQAGFRTHHLQRGDEVESYVRANQPDAVLLDVMLPGKEGTEVCRALRSFTDVPIIMVTARVEEIDRLLGFEVGADDYLCKPFSPRELVMRIKALLRRYAPPPAANAPSLQLDAEQQRAFWNGKRLELTAQQFRLLEVLSSRPGRVFSRSQLLELAYADTAEVSDRAIDSLIKNLRKRLAAEVPGQEFIHSVYGVGYRYEIEPA